MNSIQLILVVIFALTLSSCSSSEKSEDQGGFKAKVTSGIVAKEVPYEVNNKVMKGYLAMPTGEGPFPGVIVVHEWWGQTDYPRERAQQLAKMGYAAFAVDMYGNGKTVKHPNDAKTFSKQVMSNMEAAEQNFREAIKKLKEQPQVEGSKIAALGYCFGGAIVLEMARRGVEMKLAASYHGNLTPLLKNNIKPMKTRLLIFNGASDPFVKKESLNKVRIKLKKAKIRYKMVNYKGAKHAFTNPAATERGKEFDIPLAYNKRADMDSWKKTKQAFDIVFK